MYKERLNELSKKYQNEKGKLEEKKERLATLNKEVVELEKEVEKLSLEKQIVSKASDKARKAGKEMITQICSSALKEINPNLSVNIEEYEKYGVSSLDVSLISKNDAGEEVETDPASEDAGGIADIVSMGTFIAFNSLDVNNKAPVFLDEPTKFVSKENAESTAQFIKRVMDSGDKQFFILTHEQDYLPSQCDTHYYLDKDTMGKTMVKKA